MPSLEAELKTRSMSRGDSYWPRQLTKTHASKSGSCPYAKLLVWDVCPGSRHQGAQSVSSPTLILPLLSLASVPLNKLLFKRWKWGQSFGPELVLWGGDRVKVQCIKDKVQSIAQKRWAV